jgi:hypothetical protein
MLLIGASMGAVVSAQSNTVYYACINKSSGGIRMAKADQSCSANEDKIHWNQEGQPGAQGPAGATGPEGAQGPAGLTNVTVRESDVINAVAGQYADREASCLPGEKATGGGHYTGGGYGGSGGIDAGIMIVSSRPNVNSGTPTSWEVQGYNTRPSGAMTFVAYVICVSSQ